MIFCFSNKVTPDLAIGNSESLRIGQIDLSKLTGLGVFLHEGYNRVKQGGHFGFRGKHAF